jgi:hypothetical protein
LTRRWKGEENISSLSLELKKNCQCIMKRQKTEKNVARVDKYINIFAWRRS